MINQKDAHALFEWKDEIIQQIREDASIYGWDAAIVIKQAVRLALLQKVIGESVELEEV